MKRIDTYIIEKLHINKDVKSHNYFPKTQTELIDLVEQLIKERGNEADLNDIDTSEVKDMSFMFAYTNAEFDGDISKWDVSAVEDMQRMFENSQFTGKNGDISDWDVGNVRDMSNMFAWSIYDGNISDWNVRNVRNTHDMFFKASFTGKNGDINKWKLDKVRTMDGMFDHSPLENNPPKWYKS